MKRLFTIDLKNYSENAEHSRRPSARGIIMIDDHNIALVYSKKYGYFKFPGGGIHDNENQIDALIREVKEEVGLNVIKTTIREFGSVLRLQKSAIKENTVFEQENFYYTCKIEDKIGIQNLDDYEAKAEYELRIVDIEEAIRVNSSYICEGIFEQIMVDREKRVLEMISKR